MNFPKTGRVVIVDDQIHEAQIVMESLSKTGVPYCYLQGNPANLPAEEDLVDMRILILDLNLDAEAIAKTDGAEKNFKSRMYALLKRIIRKDSLYMLVVWGKEEDAYYKYVRELFSNELSDRKPFRDFSLEKSNYFDLNGKAKDDCPDPIVEIAGKIKAELQSIPTYQLLADWENCVHKATNETVSSFNSLITSGDTYEEEASALVASLSRAYLGHQFSKVQREERKLEAALMVLNELFADSLESNILAKNSIHARPELPDPPKQINYRAKVNNQILISNDISDKKYPGVVYKVEAGAVFRSILSDALNRTLVQKDHFSFSYEEKLEGDELERAQKKALNKFDEKFRKETIKDCICIELHITPLCDYAQNKVRCARIILGLIFPAELIEYIYRNTEYAYISEFPFEFQKRDFYLLLDFRYFHSVHPNSLNDREAIFRIRNQWLVDIQSRLSRHVNRPGILYL